MPFGLSRKNWWHSYTPECNDKTGKQNRDGAEICREKSRRHHVGEKERSRSGKIQICIAMSHRYKYNFAHAVEMVHGNTWEAAYVCPGAQRPTMHTLMPRVPRLDRINWKHLEGHKGKKTFSFKTGQSKSWLRVLNIYKVYDTHVEMTRQLFTGNNATGWEEENVDNNRT